MEMPHVTVTGGTKENPVYQVGGKSFIFFRNPRPDAVDPDSGERYRDVIVFWVADEAEKQALVQDESTPFFSTSHFDGHLSVLVRASRLDELSLAELQEIVQDAWLARASRHRAEQWLSSHPARVCRPLAEDPAPNPADRVRRRWRCTRRACRFALGHGPVRCWVEEIGKLLDTVNQPGARPRTGAFRIHRNE
jgi:hypothetical protein